MADEVVKDKEEEIASAEGAETLPAEPPKPTHKYAERLGKAYPDRKFESDEDYDNALNERLDYLEGYEEKGQMANKKLLALFEAEPWVGKLVRDMMNGASGRVALARNAPLEDLTPMQGDPDFEEWGKAKQSREEDFTKRRKFEEDYANNLKVSEEDVKAFAEENGLDEQKVQSLFDNIDAMMQDFHQGKVTKAHLSTMLKAFDYDNAVQKAAENGETRGKNQSIVAKKEEAAPAGDGLPKIASGTVEAEQETPKPDYMDNLLSNINKKKVL